VTGYTRSFEPAMRLALAEAAAASEHGDVPVGCVVVREGEVVGAAHNERELRAAGVDTPALIVSAHTEGGDGIDDAGLAVSGYISKPIDFGQLFERIAELTGA